MSREGDLGRSSLTQHSEGHSQGTLADSEVPVLMIASESCAILEILSLRQATSRSA
jgi:hypothetical protein